LPDYLQVWPAHGAGSVCGKALGAVPQSTVGYERRVNVGLSFEEEQPFVDAILDGQPEPPIYFARMKNLNKNGVPLLGDLPLPKACSIDELAERGGAEGAVVVDTRPDRKGFMAGHIPGSLHAPLGINFAMIVGSYVDPDTDIYLLVDHAELEEAVRTLVRIGYDRVAGYAAPSALVERGLSEEVISRIDFKDLPSEVDAESQTILDVRGAAEYAAGHVPGAMNIAHTRLAQRLDEVPKDKPVLTYCRSGNRASAAAALLASRGYDVTLVDGLFDSWPGRSTAEKDVPAGAA
ncbi:MAG: rhodanese-like domain-containing protein, partial [Longimicrobiales bacterium]|nr:rhodanese-like domain-containing protein [Longimicrobiales bacterium]